ncbi:MAG: hypothetical protein DMG44_05085 [Acidobacteria bacterium]|nr:MAG: hypothetical protein DMG44_05085 [Acidobacteriota bacterium]
MRHRRRHPRCLPRSQYRCRLPQFRQRPNLPSTPRRDPCRKPRFHRSPRLAPPAPNSSWSASGRSQPCRLRLGWIRPRSIATSTRASRSPTARRAGWVGCNILLDKIPVHARISVVNEGTPQTSQQVRASYNRLRPLEKLQVEKRGWTLDVLQVVQTLDKMEFTLADVYGHADALAKLHPNNAHVRDKIRQQLQVLRDLGLLEFLGSGSYRLR